MPPSPVKQANAAEMMAPLRTGKTITEVTEGKDAVDAYDSMVKEMEYFPET